MAIFSERPGQWQLEQFERCDRSEKEICRCESAIQQAEMLRYKSSEALTVPWTVTPIELENCDP